MALAQQTPSRAGLVWHLARMELLAFLKHPLAVFWTFVYPLVLFMLMNAIFGQRPAVEGALSYSDFLISGIVVLTVVSTALFSFTVPLIELRARSRLKLLATMPLPNGAFFLGFTMSRLLLLITFCTVFMLGLSNAMRYGSGLSIIHGLQLALFLTAGAMVLVGVGIGLAAVIKRTSTAHAVTNMVNVPVIFLSDLFLPVALFPPWMQAVAKLSPVYQFVQALRELYAGQMAAGIYIGWVAAMAVAGLALVLLAARRFSWIPEQGA